VVRARVRELEVVASCQGILNNSKRSELFGISEQLKNQNRKSLVFCLENTLFNLSIIVNYHRNFPQKAIEKLAIILYASVITW